MVRPRSQPALLLLAASACWSLFAPPLGAQPSSQRQTDAFEEAVRVQVVNLEVVVTDAEDERATGLGRGDFVLRVDGVEIPIVYFSEVGGADGSQPPAAAAQIGPTADGGY
jgi:hypothetical protein